MAIVRLTERAWLDREAERVGGILLSHLGRDGMEASELAELIREWGLGYTDAELVLIRDRLLADGVIEIA